MNEVVRIEPEGSVIETPEESFDLFQIALGGVPRGIALILCEPGGLDRHATDIMNTLAQHGYESLAADVASGRSGTFDIPDDPLVSATCEHRVTALVRVAKERGWTSEQIGMIGVGIGGRAVLAAATSLQLGAAVSFSPTLAPGVLEGTALGEISSAIATPWLGLFGERDEGAPAAGVRNLARRLHESSDVYSQVIRYPGVGRDFYFRSENGVTYAASYDGWQRAVEWLNARVAPMQTPLAKIWAQRHAQV